MSKVFLGLGSNISNRISYLREAILLLRSHPKIDVVKESSVYETKPFGFREQSDFLNMVVEIHTSLLPNDLLKVINIIEDDLGRERVIHWGPRTIDIDILLYENKVLKSEKLQIPHPYMTERLFVLVPLFEIYKNNIPGENKSLQELIDLLDDYKEEINIYTNGK